MSWQDVITGNMGERGVSMTTLDSAGPWGPLQRHLCTSNKEGREEIFSSFLLLHDNLTRLKVKTVLESEFTCLLSKLTLQIQRLIQF